MKKVEKIDVKIETALLKTLQDREKYDKYISQVNLKKVLPNTKLLLEDYAKYFELYKQDKTVDFDKFYSHFSQFWHQNDEKFTLQDLEYYRDYVFPAVNSFVVDESEPVLKALEEKLYKEELETALLSGQSPDKLQDIINKYLEKANKEEDVDIHTVENCDFDVLDKSNGIPWFLPSLQAGLMSLSDGQFVIVAADFGTGKTAFVIHQAVHAFKYLHKKGDMRPILYFNSEGLAGDVIGRFLSNLYKDKIQGGFEEIIERRKEVKDKFVKTFDASMFKCIQIANTPDFKSVKAKIEKYKPALVIIDICDKLAPDEDVQSLKKLYDGLRVLAGTGYPIIGTSQSGDTTFFNAEKKEVVKKKWLTDHDLYGSKTGKGGAADTIITIGKEEGGTIRYVAVVKKKRGSEVRITCDLIDKYSEYKEILY